MNRATTAKTMLKKKRERRRKWEESCYLILSPIYNFIDQDSVVLAEEQTRHIDGTEQKTQKQIDPIDI